MFGEGWLLDRFLIWIPLVLSLTVHEWAHAYSAFRLGDTTAADEGRMTLNPLDHIDPIGSFLLPLMGVPFGWAKPVPINPARFVASIDGGIVLTALAGPLSNVALALLSIAALGVLNAFGWAPTAGAAHQLLQSMVIINLVLAFFNLLPIPPLDGSRVVDGLIPDRLRPGWDAFAGLGPIALGAVIIVPLFVGVSLLAWPIDLAQALLDTAVEATRPGALTGR